MADLAASLRKLLVIPFCELYVHEAVTHTDNGNTFDAVGETFRLIAGVLLSHVAWYK